MPNWVRNKLTVLGWARSEIRDRMAGDDSPFDLERIVPRPEGLGDDWYDWVNEHWGTKCIRGEGDDWDNMEWERGLCSDTMHFFSAWSPPSPVVRRLSELYPDATFAIEYVEPMGHFAGYATYKAGRDLDSCCVEIDDSCCDEIVEVRPIRA